MRTKRVKRIKLLKGEKFMFFLIVFFGFVVMPTSWVYTKALLSETSIELEKINSKIDSQDDKNEMAKLGGILDDRDVVVVVKEKQMPQVDKTLDFDILLDGRKYSLVKVH